MLLRRLLRPRSPRAFSTTTTTSSSSSSSSAPLAHEVLGAAPSAAAPTMVVLHGILGSGQNFRTLGRRFARENPGSSVVLVDLRGHGESPAPPGAQTLPGCAADVAGLLRHLGVEAPEVVVGHSFGGKVALSMYAQAQEAQGGCGWGGGAGGMPRASAYWILDSRPCASPPAPVTEPQSVAAVIAACQSLAPPFATKVGVGGGEGRRGRDGRDAGGGGVKRCVVCGVRCGVV